MEGMSASAAQQVPGRKSTSLVWCLPLDCFPPLRSKPASRQKQSRTETQAAAAVHVAQHTEDFREGNAGEDPLLVSPSRADIEVSHQMFNDPSPELQDVEMSAVGESIQDIVAQAETNDDAYEKVGEEVREATAKAASNNEQTALFVDCGSGRTRAKVFIRKGEGVTQVEAGKYCSLDEWKEAAIVATLKEGSSAVLRWVEELRKLVERCGCDRVIVGATGGLRSARNSGEVTPAMLDDLRESFKQDIPAVVFKELSKEQEAEAELSAVQYVASLALPSQASQPVGLISGGGMSCQLAYYADSESAPSFLSLDADMRSTSDKMVSENASVDSVLAEFEARLELLVASTGLWGQLSGTFCVIEMLGYLGESKSQFPELPALNLGKRLLNKAEVVHALQTHLEGWMGRNQSVSDYDVAYTGLLPKCLLGLLDLVDDDARLYVSREWAVGPDSKIKPDWSLGVYATECLQPPPPQTALSKEVSITVQPRRIAVTVDWNGKIRKVTDGRASDAGVEPGWFVKDLDGVAYTLDRLLKKTTGSLPYTMTFCPQEELSPAVQDVYLSVTGEEIEHIADLEVPSTCGEQIVPEELALRSKAVVNRLVCRVSERQQKVQVSAADEEFGDNTAIHAHTRNSSEDELAQAHSLRQVGTTLENVASERRKDVVPTRATRDSNEWANMRSLSRSGTAYENVPAESRADENVFSKRREDCVPIRSTQDRTEWAKMRLLRRSGTAHENELAERCADENVPSEHCKSVVPIRSIQDRTEWAKRWSLRQAEHAYENEPAKSRADVCAEGQVNAFAAYGA